MNHQAVRAAFTHTTGWRKSSYSKAQNDCVEITTDVLGRVGVRDSKLGSSSPMLACSLPGWHAILAAAQAGRLNA